jgi:hypothetical protein
MRRNQSIPGRPLRLGEADLALLGFAAEHHAIAAAQAAALLGVAESTARGRLGRLRAAGLLGPCSSLASLPRLHRITAAGLRALSSPLPAPRAHTLSPRHDLALGWLWLAARAGVFGPLAELHSERAIRACEGRRRSPCSGDPRAGCADGRPGALQDDAMAPAAPAARPVGAARGGWGSRAVAFAHTPDLVALSAGGRRIAFELELSLKPPQRLQRILAAYAGDRRYDLVVYLTDDPRVEARVHATARRLGCEQIIRLARVRLPSDLAPHAGARAPDRLRGRSPTAHRAIRPSHADQPAAVRGATSGEIAL